MRGYLESGERRPHHLRHAVEVNPVFCDDQPNRHWTEVRGATNGCHRNIGSAKDSHFVSFPMGILPGAGGTTRWPHIAGRAKALEIVLTGRDLDAEEALAVGWLDLRSRQGRLCQAGHPHPLVVGSDGAVRQLGRGGLPVGSLDHARYTATAFTLEPTERLVLHSDGVTDCVDTDGRPFGQDRLERALAAAAGHDIDECLRTVSRALDDWRGKAAHDDDVSLLILEPEATA